jgi:hypothetical protein
MALASKENAGDRRAGTPMRKANGGIKKPPTVVAGGGQGFELQASFYFAIL